MSLQYWQPKWNAVLTTDTHKPTSAHLACIQRITITPQKDTVVSSGTLHPSICCQFLSPRYMVCLIFSSTLFRTQMYSYNHIYSSCRNWVNQATNVGIISIWWVNITRFLKTLKSKVKWNRRFGESWNPYKPASSVSLAASQLRDWIQWAWRLFEPEGSIEPITIWWLQLTATHLAKKSLDCIWESCEMGQALLMWFDKFDASLSTLEDRAP